MTTEEMKEYIKKELENSFLMAEKVYNRRFDRLPILFNLSGRTAGQLTYRVKVITKVTYGHKLRFNLKMAVDNREGYKQTIQHELAHYITIKIYGDTCLSHGTEWSSVMRALGVPADTYHNYVLSYDNLRRVPYLYTCGCKPSYFGVRKHKNCLNGNSQFRCKLCGENLKFVGHISDVGVQGDEITEQLEGFPLKSELTPQRPGPVQEYGTTISNAKAREAGYILYWNGRKCEHGHISPRYAKDGCCKECYYTFGKQYYSVFTKDLS